MNSTVVLHVAKQPDSIIVASPTFFQDGIIAQTLIAKYVGGDGAAA